MTDAAYIYNQTAKERKAARTGAFHKKNGSRSKKCTLPSDRLTARQRKELNGKMISYNLGKPMKWIEFIQLPLDVQEEYLHNLIEKYEARRKDASEMFCVPYSTFGKYLADKFPGKEFWGKPSAHKPSETWLDFIGVENVDLPSEDTIVQPEPSHEVKQPTLTEVSEDKPAEKKTVSLNVENGCVTLAGDPRAIFEKALLILDPSKEYRIKIEFAEKGGE